MHINLKIGYNFDNRYPNSYSILHQSQYGRWFKIPANTILRAYGSATCASNIIITAITLLLD